jgi:perosamine synthetase
MIPLTEPYLDEREIELVTEALRTGWVSSKGRFVGMFEEGFSNYCGTRFGAAACNGTAALHLALMGLGVREGDEVILPSLTFISTASSVKYIGAKPVLVDSEPDTWCIDPAKVEDRITDKTKAIIAVHLYGHPADMDRINEIAKRYGLYVIEDAAEAHGARYKGKPVGGLGDVGCFSFYGNKTITTGEGGMCVTDNQDVVDRIRVLRDHGMDPNRKYWHPYVGYNYRMTNLQAAMGVAQLEKLDRLIAVKIENAKTYRSVLEKVDGLTLPPEASWARNVYWLYSLLIGPEFRVSRDVLMRELEASGIESRPFFLPIHTQPPYLDRVHDFKVADRLSSQGINLPSSPKLTREEIEKVTSTIEHSTSSS